MLSNIYEEPKVLKDIIDDFEKRQRDFKEFVEREKPRNWLIFATGSSANALWSAKYYIEKIAGVTIDIQEPAAFLHYEKIKSSIDFILAVSQSGRTTSTIRALKETRTTFNIPSAVLTSNLESPITEFTDLVIDIGCGIEHVGFVTKGFSATVLTFMLMGITAGTVLNQLTTEEAGRELKKLEKAIGEISKVIEKSESFYSQHADELIAIPRFAIIGYGPTYGIAKEGETKFTETIHVPATGYEMETYLHGPFLEINQSYGLIFLQTRNMLKKRSEKMKQYFSRYTEHCLTFTTDDGIDDGKLLSFGLNIDELLSPLLMVIPLQVFAYRISTDRGINLEENIFSDMNSVLASKV